MSVAVMRAIAALACLGTVVVFADEPRLVIDSGGHQAIIRFVAFTHDGKYLVSAGDDKVVRIWDVATEKTVRTIRERIGDWPEGVIYAAALSPDERYLAVGGWLASAPDYGVIRIHDFQTGNVVALLKGHTDSIHSLTFSPDGRYLASGSADKTVRVWNMADRTTVHVLSGHSDAVFAVAFSPDGQRLVSGSDDKALRLWEVSSGQMLREMGGHSDTVRSAVFSSDGRYIASGGRDRTIRLWDGRTGELIKQLATQGGEVRGLSFSSDGRTLLSGSASGDNICHIFEVPSGREINSFAGQKNAVVATAFPPDGKLAATAGGDQEEIYLWNATNAQIVRKLVGAGQTVWSVGFDSDGRSIAFGNSARPGWAPNNYGPLQKSIFLGQDTSSGVSLGASLESEAPFIRARGRIGDLSLQVIPGKRSDTDILEVLRSGKVEHEIARDPGAGNRHTAYSLSPDQTLIASGGDDGILSLYSTSGQKAAACIGHTSQVWAVAFSPDGKTLVSGSADQTIRLWDVSPSSCRNLITVFVGSDNEWVAWTPQGYYTASAKGDKYIGWHVNQGLNQQAKFYPVAQFQKQFYRPDIVAEFLKTRDIAVAVRTANGRRGGEVRSQPVLGSADVLATLPPLISISSPERNEITVQEKTFRVRAEALSNTLPIADVKILLNGVQVSDKGGAPAGAGKRRQIELEVELEPGTNILSIIASNEKAMSEPETRKIYYRSGTGTSRGDKPKLIALAIGISKYKRPDMALKYGDADAGAIEAVLKTQDNPNNLLFSTVEVHELPNDKATRSGIVRELDWLNREGTQRDLRVLFLSGHGDVDGGNNYFFFSHEHDPDDYDLSDVPWDLLIRKLTAAKGRAVLFVDTCHAGAVMGNTRKADAKPLSQIIKEMETQELGLVTFAASSGPETSVELDSFQHGAFTQALLEGLVGKKADLNHDGVIETNELGTWLSQRIRELTGGKQHADYEPMPGIPSFPLFQVSQ